MRGVSQRDTFFSVRLDKTTKEVLKMARLNGNDITEFILKSVIFKLEKGTRIVNPEFEQHLIELEEAEKRKYQARIAIIHDIRAAIAKNNKQSVTQCNTGNFDPPISSENSKNKIWVDDDEDKRCPHCDRPLKNGRCTCTRWKESEVAYGST